MLQEFRNRTSMNNRSITKMKRMKMINKSRYYYTTTRFQSLGNCVIIRDVTKLFVL